MLLTGFDAPRLKKLYVGRIIRSHNLLQALTRVNRPYKDLPVGYVVDFADIRSEFDKTNKAYFEELQNELGDAFGEYDTILMTSEEIQARIDEVRNILFDYRTENLEEFRVDIDAVSDKKKLIEVRKALESLKVLDNALRLNDQNRDLLEVFDIDRIRALSYEVSRRIDTLNAVERLQDSIDTEGILNDVLNKITFTFHRISTVEMVIADSFRDQLEKTRHEFERSLDAGDPQYISLLDKLKQILSKKNIEEYTADDMKDVSAQLEEMRRMLAARNAADTALCAKYRMDAKFMRVHKRLRENPPPIADDITLNKVLLLVKDEADSAVLSNRNMLTNEAYFCRSLDPIIMNAFRRNTIQLKATQLSKLDMLDSLISKEYINERKRIG
jgi:type I restriction enzyme, R subunit